MATCETHGHLWGHDGKCVMCKEPKVLAGRLGHASWCAHIKSNKSCDCGSAIATASPPTERGGFLKPCPFCGCEACMHVHGSIFRTGSGIGYRVECEGACHAMTCYWHTEAEAAANWDRRAPEPCEQSPIEVAARRFWMRWNPSAGLDMAREYGCREEWNALDRALREGETELAANPFACRTHIISEPHLNMWRLIVGFNSAQAVDAAHEFVGEIPRLPLTKAGSES